MNWPVYWRHFPIEYLFLQKVVIMVHYFLTEKNTTTHVQGKRCRFRPSDSQRSLNEDLWLRSDFLFVLQRHSSNILVQPQKVQTRLGKGSGKTQREEVSPERGKWKATRFQPRTPSCVFFSALVKAKMAMLEKHLIWVQPSKAKPLPPWLNTTFWWFGGFGAWLNLTCETSVHCSHLETCILSFRSLIVVSFWLGDCKNIIPALTPNSLL